MKIKSRRYRFLACENYGEWVGFAVFQTTPKRDVIKQVNVLGWGPWDDIGLHAMPDHLVVNDLPLECGN